MKKRNSIFSTAFLMLFISAALFADNFSVPGFKTDWSRISIDPSEIRSGGPPKDGIPSLTNPLFVSADSADSWLTDNESVILIQRGNTHKVYPLQILAWHEIINDTIGDLALSVTWCPLCNTTVVFNSTVSGQILEFGTTGRLRFSNMLMYDRQTESWWQQAEGKAVIGQMIGTQMELYPSLLLPWKDVKDIPGIKVVSRQTGYNRPYGRNPYEGYDNPEGNPFLLGRADRSRIDTSENSLLDRVILVPSEGQNIIVSYRELSNKMVINRGDTVIMWESGTASPLDSNRVGSGRDIGSANAFSPILNGRKLTFEKRSGKIYDRETGSHWNSRGVAVRGELAGKSLSALPSIQHFWFSARLLEY